MRVWWLLPPCVGLNWGWVKQERFSDLLFQQAILCLSGSHSSPEAPDDGFGRVHSHLSPSPQPWSTPQSHSTQQGRPHPVLAELWAPALLTLPAVDLCNTFSGLHFPVDWKQRHLIFSKKICLEVQLPWITWWRGRPDLAVNNFPLSHTGAWLAVESMLQMMVLDVERGRKRESVCESRGAQSWGLCSVAATSFTSGVLRLNEWWGQKGQNGGWASGLFHQLVYRTSLSLHLPPCHRGACVRMSDSCMRCGVAQRASFRIGHIQVLVPDVLQFMGP